MKISRLQKALKGLTDAITRFPLTTLFLIGAVVVNSIDIQGGGDYSKYLLTLIVGAILGAVAQVIFERFCKGNFVRIILNVGAVLLTVGYYLIIMPLPQLSIEISIRTAVALFALIIAFIWIPSIKSKVTFNESFMVAFKAFFISLFFAGVIFAGTSIIITATDVLLFEVDSKAYSHAANIVFILFAPVYFLSLIPVYYGISDANEPKESMELKEEIINKMAGCPKYLEILISYIIIPLTAVFTLILGVYIATNIAGDFWRDNLLEPMIVSYSITVILVYILASRLENRFAQLFRKIFPKVLVPIVIFQTIASIMKIGDMGVTHTRYYVIAFGIFAIASGILFSFLPVRKNGIIAIILIVISVISIVPPVDAFTVSRNNQTGIIRDTLIKNNMLDNNRIKPGTDISAGDRKKIVEALGYLNRMDYTHMASFLPPGFEYYSDFEKVFGFKMYDWQDETKYVYIRLDDKAMLDIAGYEVLAETTVMLSRNHENYEVIGNINKAGKSFTLKKATTLEDCIISLFEGDDQELLSFSTKEIFEEFNERDSGAKESISIEEATFSKENEHAVITVVIKNMNFEVSPDRAYYAADVFILVKIK
ncbi:MAG TPA: DUF4153 domain-containing protein [Clostridiaceae bacterium]|nr:DUF4153 domain-containing protein [Clostridiaceae bacterium]